MTDIVSEAIREEAAIQAKIRADIRNLEALIRESEKRVHAVIFPELEPTLAPVESPPVASAPETPAPEVGAVPAVPTPEESVPAPEAPAVAEVAAAPESPPSA